MPRNLRQGEGARRAKARREFALSRNELRQPTSERAPAAGPTSMAIKTEDPAVTEMVEAFLAKREKP